MRTVGNQSLTAQENSHAEIRYTQIEKDCLAGVWGCERFTKYLSGMDRFKLITDHKPLVALINTKDPDTVPMRCQRLLQLMRFNAAAEYAPGKTLMVADTLSRSPVDSTTDSNIEADVCCYVNSIRDTLPASRRKLDEIRRAILSDSGLQVELKLVRDGWPDHAGHLHTLANAYFHHRGELSETDVLVTRGSCNVIPPSLREEMLTRIHEGHQSLSKCRERAQAKTGEI